jgi:hypothetical protein
MMERITRVYVVDETEMENELKDKRRMEMAGWVVVNGRG